MFGINAGDIRFTLQRLLGTQNEDHRKEVDQNERVFTRQQQSLELHRETAKEVTQARTNPASVQRFAASSAGRADAVSTVQSAQHAAGGGVATIG